MTYDDDHWLAVIKTIIDRVGMVHFLELLSEVLHDDLQKAIDEHMRTIEAQGEG